MTVLNVLTQAIVNGLLIGGVYALVAVGLNLMFGVMKLVNFAHGEFLMAGMYVALSLAGLALPPGLGNRRRSFSQSASRLASRASRRCYAAPTSSRCLTRSMARRCIWVASTFRSARLFRLP